MHLRPIEHLENRNKKDSLHVFFVFYNWSTKKNRIDGSFQNRTETEPNPRFFSEPKPNLKNQFRTFFEVFKLHSHNACYLLHLSTI